MTESQLRAFVAVAESASFGAAAQRLHMSQPGISRAVASLEAELGGPLFLRHRGSVELTALGERALPRSRTILAESDALRQERDAQQEIARGRVRLGSMPSVSAELLPPLLGRIERRHPELEVAVVDGHDDELVAWVRAGVVDVAVVAGAPDGLGLHPLLVDEFLAVLPANHPLATRETVRCRELAGEPFVLTRAGCERLVLELLGAAGVVPQVSHEVTEASSILALVAEGHGVSIMPRLAARRPPRTVALRSLAPRAERHLSLATLRARSQSPAVRAFLAAAS
jgi:DNA-binding transcriptional LysR family regulator